MNEIIYLEPDDDITAVIGRLKEIAPQTVSLVIPRGGNIAQSVVNLKLLKREIEKIGKQVSLVTNDKISKNLASQVGISVYSSVHEAKAARPVSLATTDAAEPLSNQLKINRYNKGEGEEEAETAEEEKIEEQPAEKTENEIPIRHQPLDQSIKRPVPEQNVPVGSRFRSKNVTSRKKPIIIICASFLLIALVFSVIFLPKAEASIILKTENIVDTANLTLDKNIKVSDEKTLSVPGTLVSVIEELTKEFPATGSKNVGTKAVGEIKFYNYYSGDPVAVAAGTTIVSVGKNFLTDKDVVIPGGTLGAGTINPGVIKVTITSSEAGDDYNLPPSKFLVSSFSGVQKEKIYAMSEAALTGGTTKKVSIVSDADLAKAKDEIKAEVGTNLSQKILAQVEKDGKKIIDSSLTVTETAAESSKKSGDEADKFTYKISAKGEAIAFLQSDVRSLLVKKVATGLASDQMVVNPDKAEISYVLKESKPEEGKVVLITTFNGKKGKKYDANLIKKQIINKKYGTALSTIQSLAEVEKADLVVWPKFIPRTPLIGLKIKVNFDYIK